jgi:signal transduction histidine kinase
MEELRASRRRLVLAADDDRRRIERELHQCVQQHLVALDVNLQQLRPLIDADRTAALVLVEEMGQTVRRALEDAAWLAQRIYPPLLDEHGLGAALRAAAVTAGVRASVDIVAGGGCPPDVARTVYLCWIDALEHAGPGARPTISVRDEHRALAFDVAYDGTVLDELDLEGLRERVDALDGRLTTRSDGRSTRVSGVLPVGG